MNRTRRVAPPGIDPGSRDGRFGSGLALRVLSWMLPAGDFSEGVVGDLAEEHLALAKRRGSVRADVWLWGVAVGLGLRLGGVRAWRRLLATLQFLAAMQFRSVRSARRAQVRERSAGSNSQTGDSIVRNLIGDFRLSLRSLVRQPGFSLIVLLTIAVGIAANAVVFSVLDALVLRPIPIPNLERLTALNGALPAQGYDRDQLSPADYVTFAEEATAFDELVADTWWSVNLTGIDRPEQLMGRLVTPGYLEVLGVRPALGRTLAAEREDSSRRAVVLSHRFWTGRFAADPDILGRRLRLNGEEYEVVGVAPQGFSYPQGVDLWAPLELSPEDRADRSFQYINAIGRLAPGKSIDDAKAELALIARRLEEQFPESNQGRTVVVRTLAESVVDIGAPVFLGMWQAATIFVLLIACVNVANLLIARGSGRHRELSLRVALGAARGRIIRLLLAESFLLALAGALIGVPLAYSSLEAIKSSMPFRITRFVHGWNEIGLDGRVFLFTFLVAGLTAVLFGLVPALKASRPNLVSGLRSGTRLAGGRSEVRGRGLLVSAELAIAMVLLVAAGLSIRGTLRMMYGDQGYRADGVLTAELNLPEEQYASIDSRRQLVREVLDRARALPGVVDVGIANVLPSSGNNNYRSIVVEGAPASPVDELPLAQFRVASEGLLEVLEIPIVEGRSLKASDREDAAPVAVISAAMAQRLWPGETALGKRFRTSEDDGSPWVTVVGVCGDVLHDWFNARRPPTFYLPVAQRPRHGLQLAIRTAGEPASLADELYGAVGAVDPDLPLYNVVSLQQLISDRTIGLRFMTALMSAFGVIGLVLAAIGVYGLMSQAVARSRHELGVRVALGARKSDVLRLTFGRSMKTTALGVAVGIALAFGAAKLMASALFGVIELEALTFVQLPVVLVAIALIATWIPAWRAARTDPASTLRSD